MIFRVLPAAFARSGKRKAGPPTTRAPAAVSLPNCLRVSPRFLFFDMITSVFDDSVHAARGASACRRGGRLGATQGARLFACGTLSALLTSGNGRGEGEIARSNRLGCRRD